MVMDMVAVCVRCDNKGVFSFGETHRQLVAHLVSFFCGNLARFE